MIKIKVISFQNPPFLIPIHLHFLDQAQVLLQSKFPVPYHHFSIYSCIFDIWVEVVGCTIFGFDHPCDSFLQNGAVFRLDVVFLVVGEGCYFSFELIAFMEVLGMFCLFEPVFECFNRVVDVFIEHMRLPLALELSISWSNLWLYIFLRNWLLSGKFPWVRSRAYTRRGPSSSCKCTSIAELRHRYPPLSVFLLEQATISDNKEIFLNLLPLELPFLHYCWLQREQKVAKLVFWYLPGQYLCKSLASTSWWMFFKDLKGLCKRNVETVQRCTEGCLAGFTIFLFLWAVRTKITLEGFKLKHLEIFVCFFHQNWNSSFRKLILN